MLGYLSILWGGGGYQDVEIWGLNNVESEN